MLTMFNCTVKPLILLTLTVHLLFAKQLLIQAEDDEYIEHNSQQISSTTTTPPPPPPVIICQSPIDLTVDSSWLETVVFGDFRIWHIIFSGLGILIAIAVLLCCLFRCRIPRTKQEIEADYTRKKITKLINSHLRKIKLEELEFDPSNLLPVLQRVNDLEENRVKKHRSFEMRRLNWRQKLKRLITRKDISYDDEYGMEDLKNDAQGYKMTKEEMEKVEKEVEDAKIDSTAFNVITDQIAILSYFETDKAKKKRLKEEKKQQKKLEKEQLKKKKTKDDKTVGEIKRKSADQTNLVELNVSTLVKNAEDKKKSIDSIAIDMEKDIGEESKQKDEMGKSKSTKMEPQRSKLGRFSFRNTVMSLVSGIRIGGSGASNSNENSQKIQKPKQTERPKSPHDEIVINIGLVGRQTKEKNDNMTKNNKINDNDLFKDNIPQIKIPDDTEKDQNKKRLKSKPKITRMDAVNRNQLQIPELSISEINVTRRDTKIEGEKNKERKSRRQTKKDLELSQHLGQQETINHGKGKMSTDKNGKKLKKSNTDNKITSNDEEISKIKSEKIEEKKQKLIKQSSKDWKRSSPKSHLESEEKTPEPTVQEQVKLDKAQNKKVFFKSISGEKRSQFSRTLESIDEVDPDKLVSLSSTKNAKEEFEKKFSEHKKQLKSSTFMAKDDRKRMITKQTTTSSSEIEIPVEHVYSGGTMAEQFQIEVHQPTDYFAQTLSKKSSGKKFRTEPHRTQILPVEHFETLEKYAVESPNDQQKRKLIIEKTLDVVVGSSTPVIPEIMPLETEYRLDRTKQNTIQSSKKARKKKKVKLIDEE